MVSLPTNPSRDVTANIPIAVFNKASHGQVILIAETILLRFKWSVSQLKWMFISRHSLFPWAGVVWRLKKRSVRTFDEYSCNGQLKYLSVCRAQRYCKFYQRQVERQNTHGWILQQYIWAVAVNHFLSFLFIRSYSWGIWYHLKGFIYSRICICSYWNLFCLHYISVVRYFVVLTKAERDGQTDGRTRYKVIPIWRSAQQKCISDLQANTSFILHEFEFGKQWHEYPNVKVEKLNSPVLLRPYMSFLTTTVHAGHTRKASRISKAAVDDCGKGVGNFYLS